MYKPQSCICNLGSTIELAKLEESFLTGEWTFLCDGTPESDSGVCGKESVAGEEPSTTLYIRYKRVNVLIIETYVLIYQ